MKKNFFREGLIKNWGNDCEGNDNEKYGNIYNNQIKEFPIICSIKTKDDMGE